MSSSAVSIVTAPGPQLLTSIRAALDASDEAYLCVAFAQPRGVHLVQRELKHLAKRGQARALVTTTLGMSHPEALASLSEAGAAVRLCNPGRSTYHPKVFVGRRGDTLHAVVGSANLTSGLVANVEVATVLDGPANDNALSALWEWAREQWENAHATPWRRPKGVSAAEAIEPELLRQLVEVQRKTPTVYTLGRAQPNYISDVTEGGMWVETQRSRERAQRQGGGSVEWVEPRMLNLAWDALRARGVLTNDALLNELRIHRSSFVCAVLAKLDGVEVIPGRKIGLRWNG
jgi:HKD family nuclease